MNLDQNKTKRQKNDPVDPVKATLWLGFLMGFGFAVYLGYDAPNEKNGNSNDSVAQSNEQKNDSTPLRNLAQTPAGSEK